MQINIIITTLSQQRIAISASFIELWFFILSFRLLILSEPFPEIKDSSIPI